MYILFDENLLSKKLKQPLQNEGHLVKNVEEMGWRGTPDRELLLLARENGFEVFITADQNLPYEQNLRNFTLKIVILDARNTRPSYLLPFIQRVCDLLPSLKPASITIINDAGEALVFPQNN